MPTFTAYWSDDMCRHAETHGLAGAPLRILWGGWNQETQYERYRFGPGDRVIVVHVANTFVHLVGAMIVTEKCSRDDWLARHPADERVAGGTQIVVGTMGTELRFDRALPLEVVETIDFHASKAPRRIKLVEDGRLKNSVSLRGVFRLTDETAERVMASFARASFDDDAALDPRLRDLFRAYQAAPADAGLAAVLGDALSERGDPRGDVIALELALPGATTNREDQKLRGRLERLTGASPRAIVGRAGGFPYRDAWGSPRRAPRPA